LQNEEAGNVSLKNEINRLASNFGEDDFVGAVIGALPKEATSDEGIANEAAIKDRLAIVVILCAPVSSRLNIPLSLLI
jgi:hypothetical protein